MTLSGLIYRLLIRDGLARLTGLVNFLHTLQQLQNLSKLNLTYSDSVCTVLFTNSFFGNSKSSLVREEKIRNTNQSKKPPNGFIINFLVIQP